MSQFLDPNITAIAADTCDKGDGTGKQQFVIRIETKLGEITLSEADFHYAQSLLWQATGAC